MPNKPFTSQKRFCMALSLVVMAAEWVLLVGGVKPHEMILGGISVAASAAFLYAVSETQTMQLDLRWRDLLTCRHIPGYLLSDAARVTVALFQDLFLGQRTKSLYKVCSFDADDKSPLKLSRQVLVTAYTSATPNSIVLGIDCERKRMIFHQIAPDAVSTMARSLGAER